MSAIIYNKAFHVELKHDFYSLANDKYRINNDLEFTPSPATADLMTSARMRWFKTGKGFSMYYKAIDDGFSNPPMASIDTAAEFLFTFGVTRNVETFLNITELDLGSTYTAGKKLLLSATPASPIATPTLIDQLLPRAFTYDFRAAGGYTGSVYLNVKHESNTPSITYSGLTAATTTNIYSVGVDLTKEKKGLYTITAKKTSDNSVVHSATIYVDNDLFGKNVFGMLRIQFNAPVLPALSDVYDEDVFSYTFLPRAVYWRYIVTVKASNGFFTGSNHLQINGSGGITFNAMNSGQPHSTFKINDHDTVIFTSNAAIAFSDTPRFFTLVQVQTGITLDKELNTKLPNASYSTPDSNRLNTLTPTPPYAEVFVFVESITLSTP